MEQISAEKLSDYSDFVVIDVRTPTEFDHGHIPGAFNIPLLTNEQRVIIGTLYKQEGRQAAILKGFDLIGNQWSNFIREAEKIAPYKKVIVHCWRGGMRSGSMAWAFNLYGFTVKVLKGGYKAYRKQVNETFGLIYPLMVLGGRTGCRKTLILHEIKKLGQQIIDLEGLVNHQGSTFGSKGILLQPSQEQFENNFASALSRLDIQQPIWVENESVVIGRIVIPKPFFLQITQAKVIDIQKPFEDRVKFLVEEYGHLDHVFLEEALIKISKRLGPMQTKEALIALSENRMEDFITWALQYYDKQYDKSKLKRIPATIYPLQLQEMDLVDQAKQIIAFFNQINN